MAISYNPSALLKQLKTTFAQNLNVDTAWISALCEEVKSESNDEKHPWVGQPPQMSLQEDGEDVKFTGLSDAVVTLTNKIYSGGVEFLRKDIDDQQSGLLDRAILGLATTASGIYNKHLSDLIVDGENSTTYTGYDGYQLYGDTHPARGDSGTHDNKLAGTGTTVAQMTTDLAAAMAAMSNVKAENGEPFLGSAKVQYYVMVPPALAYNMNMVCRAALTGGGDTNLFQGQAQVIVNPRLTATDTNDWYLFASAPGLKPFIFQKRDPIEFASLDSAQDSDLAFSREVYRYKVRARHAFGIGYWQLTNKTVNS